MVGVLHRVPGVRQGVLGCERDCGFLLFPHPTCTLTLTPVLLSPSQMSASITDIGAWAHGGVETWGGGVFVLPVEGKASEKQRNAASKKDSAWSLLGVETLVFSLLF